MWIMNIVWPVTALYAGPIGLLIYFMIGRTADNQMQGGRMEHEGRGQRPFWQSVLIGTLHCGAGCTLGDVIAANWLRIVPFVIFGSRLVGEWTVEFALALVIGIVFQYYAIKPMRQLTPNQAWIAALKADVLSLTFWQIGMYGWMAVANFLIFHHTLDASSTVFWLMMQIGMLCGLVTAFPVNWWLIKKGVKEAM